jgi:hypothetical protein
MFCKIFYDRQKAFFYDFSGPLAVEFCCLKGWKIDLCNLLIISNI